MPRPRAPHRLAHALSLPVVLASSLACSAGPGSAPAVEEEPIASAQSAIKATTTLACPWVGAPVGPAGSPLLFANPSSSIDLLGTDLGSAFQHQGSWYLLFGDATRSFWSADDDAMARWWPPSAPSGRDCPKIEIVTEPTKSGLTAAPLHAWVAGAGLTMGANRTFGPGFSDGSAAYTMLTVERPCASAADCRAGDACTAGMCSAPIGEGGPFPRAILGIGKFRGAPGASRDVDVVSSIMASQFEAVTVKAVPAFDPRLATPSLWYGEPAMPPGVGAPATRPALFVWGRPSFASAHQQGAYLVYYDLQAPPDTRWSKPRYLKGFDVAGRPTWGVGTPTDLEFVGARSIFDPATEVVDGAPILATGQLSVSFVPGLGKWLMIYGGRPITADTSFADAPGYGIYFRVAPDPWGPWTAPQRLWDARSAGFYAAGGPMWHPLTNSTRRNEAEFGASLVGGEYGVAILDPLVVTTTGGARVQWTVSTWNPYRVFLMSSAISR